MWFKNLRIYRFTKALDLDADSLNRQLDAQRFKGCASMDLTHAGWLSPFGPDHELLCHAANGYFLFRYGREDKLLPSTVVRELLDEKIREIEQEQHRKVYKQEKERLKDELIQTLLPRAFSRKRSLSAYIDSHRGLLIVDSAAANRAEEVLTLLRQSLGSLPVVPLACKIPAGSVLTRWLGNQDIPAGLSLGDECELREAGEDGSLVRCKRQDLSSDEITAHLSAGKEVSLLALNWQDRVQFILDRDLVIKRLKMGDILLDQQDPDLDDPLAQLDADFSLMSLEIADLIEHLTPWFGGEQDAS